jgi:hypothetical protein
MTAIPRRLIGIAIPLALGGLELVHPASPAAAGWWIPFHIALIVGYGLLVAVLWSVPNAHATVARAVLAVFLASNVLFLAIDGVGAQSDADALSANPLVEALANVTGAAWSLALLSVAATLQLVGRTRIVVGGSILAWLTFVASSYLPGAGLASRAAAVATGAWAVYTAGTSAVPFALLVFAAVLRQHVGPEAALGMLSIALSLAITGRRSPTVT